MSSFDKHEFSFNCATNFKFYWIHRRKFIKSTCLMLLMKALAALERSTLCKELCAANEYREREK